MAIRASRYFSSILLSQETSQDHSRRAEEIDAGIEIDHLRVGDENIAPAPRTAYLKQILIGADWGRGEAAQLGTG